MVRTFVLAAVLGQACLLSATVRVAYLPFKDKVRLKEAWDLSVDIPRWFSQTVDTIDGHDNTVVSVPFDTVLSIIKENALKREDYLSQAQLARLATRLGADCVMSGTVTRFLVMKRAINTDAPLNTSNQIGSNTFGSGGVTVMGGLQSYTAEIAIDVDMYDGRSGKLMKNIPLSVKERDGGLKVWLPIHTDNDEMNFYNMSRNPFGSRYFQRNVAGAVMKHYSYTLKNALRAEFSAGRTAAATDVVVKEHISGRVLERTGPDVYVDLGTADNIMQGEYLEVMRPDHALLGAGGDTLGWVDRQVALLRVRFVKAAHFSQASIVEEADSVTVGSAVRVRMGAGR